MKIICVVFAFFCFVATTTAQWPNNNTLITSGNVSCTDKKLILDIHNDLRRRVANGTLPGQPKASNMNKLVWDDALENLAQSWADKMSFKHSPVAIRKDPRWSALGECIVYSTDPKFSWLSGINFWYDENTKYTYGPITQLLQGHYTQLVWAATQYVGCGQVLFRNSSRKVFKLYVCVYGPCGNYFNVVPYKVGPGCEDLCCDKQPCDKPLGAKCSD